MVARWSWGQVANSLLHAFQPRFNVPFTDFLLSAIFCFVSNGKTRLTPRWVPGSCREASRVNGGVDHGPPGVVPQCRVFSEQHIVPEPLGSCVFSVCSNDGPHVRHEFWDHFRRTAPPDANVDPETLKPGEYIKGTPGTASLCSGLAVLSSTHLRWQLLHLYVLARRNLLGQLRWHWRQAFPYVNPRSLERLANIVPCVGKYSCHSRQILA